MAPAPASAVAHIQPAVPPAAPAAATTPATPTTPATSATPASPATTAPATPATAPPSDSSGALRSPPDASAHAILKPTYTGPQEPSPSAYGGSSKNDEHAPSEIETLQAARARAELEARGRALDAVLADAAQDLGLTVDLTHERVGADSAAPPDEVELANEGPERPGWLIVPSLRLDGNDLLLRIIACPPRSPTLLVRTERIRPDRLAVRAVVMLRDLLTLSSGGTSAPKPAGGRFNVSPEPAPSGGALATRARSAGRATLALNGALFGGFVGYSVQRSSGSDDPRLLYPLMAIGTGLGLGLSMVVADEWDVGLGDAWFVAAGGWWPALSGVLIARGNRDRPVQDRYAYGLVGAGAGLGLTALALSFRGIGEGGALIAHSGGAFGMFLGGLTELALKGAADAATPYTGAGYGAAVGVVLGGALATQIGPEPTRVLVVDLGAGLGGLAGAAAASPLIFGTRTPARDRAFLITTMATTVAGGAAAALFAHGAVSTSDRRGAPTLAMGAPVLGIVGMSSSRTGALDPVFGAGWSGSLP